MEEKSYAKDAVPVVCLSYERDEFCIKAMNLAFKNLFPLEIEDLIGKNLASLVGINESLSWLNTYAKKDQSTVNIGKKRFLLEEIIVGKLHIYIHKPVPLNVCMEKMQPFENELDKKNREHAHCILKYVETCGNISHWSFDMSKKCFSCSPGVLKLLAIKRSEKPFGEQEIKQIVHPEDWEELKYVFLEATQGEAQAISYRTLSPDGSVHWMHSHMIPKNCQGVETICGTIQNITSQKKEEEEKIQALMALEKIRVSKKKFVETFTGTLKAPLTRILTLAQILSDESGEEEHEILEEIIFSADEILSTIEGKALEYSKNEEVQPSEKMLTYKLEGILEQLSKKTKDSSSVKISYLIDKNISISLSEKEKCDLDDVLTHLMEHLTTQALAKCAEVMVTIHGACTRFMKLKFEIVGSCFSEPLKENGLSKTSAHFLVAKSKATDCSMNLNRYPLEGEKERYVFFLRVKKNKTLLGGIDLKDQHLAWQVLVISDLSKSDRKMWNELMIQWNLEIDFVKNFQETAKALTEKEYDFIAIDENLRQGSGVQILSYIRKGHDQNESEIPVVVTTIGIREESRKTFLQVGANYFATKPIESTVLTQIIGSVKNRRMRRVDRNHPLIYRYVHLKNIEKLKKEKGEPEFCEFLLKTIQRDRTYKKKILDALWPLNKSQLLESLQMVESDISAFGTGDLYESVDMMQSALRTDESIGIEVVGKDFLEEFELFVDELQDFLRRQKRNLQKDKSAP